MTKEKIAIIFPSTMDSYQRDLAAKIIISSVKSELPLAYAQLLAQIITPN